MTRPVTRPLTLLLGVLLGLAPLLSATLTTPTYAAAEPDGELCAANTGISIVVDATGLGGGVTQECVETVETLAAAQAFEDAGVELTPVTSVPGVVCRVQGEPADAGCGAMPEGNAYWGLFVAGEDDLTTGDATWAFAEVGVEDQQVEVGDYVAFVWQDGTEPVAPAVDPVPADAGGETEGTDPAPGEGEAPQATQGTDADLAADEGVEDGTPVWIFYVIVVVVAVGGLSVGLLRRRRRRSDS